MSRHSQQSLELLAEAVSRHVTGQSSAPALVWRGRTTTYGELGELVDAAAEGLRALALADGVAVAIPAEKSPRVLALILACLAARRPALMLSPDLGAKTLEELLPRAGCALVLSAAEGRPFVTTPVADDASAAVERAAAAALLLTTSGSTGVPKVVPISQSAIARFSAWAGDHFGLAPGKAVLSYAPINFDVSLLDVWSTLAHGACVVLVEEDRATRGKYLVDLVEANDVRVVQAVPLFFQVILAATSHAPPRLSAVEHVVVTGEAMPLKTWRSLREIFVAAALHNLYGCTETNDSFIHEVDLDDVGVRGTMPIGQPLPGVATRVVAPDGTELAGSGTGELWVSTPFQTQGYVDSSLDERKFVVVGDAGSPRVFFRTGDLVRRAADGSVTLDGRADFELKVRGVRVNLNEIEAVLLDHPAVLEAAVFAVVDAVAGNRLQALVRARGVGALALRTHCAARLTRLAIPAITIVDSPLPKTSTGKVDRARVRRLAGQVASPRAESKGAAT